VEGEGKMVDQSRERICECGHSLAYHPEVEHCYSMCTKCRCTPFGFREKKQSEGKMSDQPKTQTYEHALLSEIVSLKEQIESLKAQLAGHEERETLLLHGRDRMLDKIVGLEAQLAEARRLAGAYRAAAYYGESWDSQEAIIRLTPAHAALEVEIAKAEAVAKEAEWWTDYMDNDKTVVDAVNRLNDAIAHRDELIRKRGEVK
jgi:hypothetical protein